MLIAWTSTEKKEQAQALAREIIEKSLAACVQIDGPVESLYRWEGKIETCSEYRLTIKLLESQQPALETYIKAHHPYSTPEWIVARAEYVAEKYLSWAVSVSTSSTL